ncbi:helix-turn-helix domain-containing protein [Oscillospiraceae bacterium 44-5]
MTLRDLVKEYRANHSLSQRQFATMCGLSNGYVSMLEKNMNPKTGLPVTPSLPALKKIATGMGISLTDLFTQADDIPVDLLVSDSEENAPAPETEGGHSSLDVEIASLVANLPPEKKQEALNYIRYLADHAEN